VRGKFANQDTIALTIESERLLVLCRLPEIGPRPNDDVPLAVGMQEWNANRNAEGETARIAACPLIQNLQDLDLPARDKDNRMCIPQFDDHEVV
jgi:hypothetical protein